MEIIKHKIISISAKVGTPSNNILAIGDCSRLPFCISLLNAYIPNLKPKLKLVCYTYIKDDISNLTITYFTKTFEIWPYSGHEMSQS